METYLSNTFVLRVVTWWVQLYRYLPPHKAASEIRLLKVHSISNVWGLRSIRLYKAELISVPIASTPPFADVSHKWDNSSLVPVLLGGRRLDVPRSICDLVDHLLQPDGNASHGRELLRIDSICIDQLDTDEKAGRYK